MEQAIEMILAALTLYLLVGVAFAIPFHWRWAVKMDQGVHQAGWFFRVIITPGVIGLWPLLLRRVLRGDPPPSPDRAISMERLRRLQLLAAQALAFVIPPLFALSLFYRPGPPPVQSTDLPGLNPAPLADATTEEFSNLFPRLQINGRIRTSGESRQLELLVANDLKAPAAALFWAPVGATPSSPSELVFLGSVYGPATLRFSLPFGTLDGSGNLLIYSLTRTELLESVPWPTKGDS